MPGFRFPLGYNSPPLVYHNPTVHFYKVEEEEQTEDSNEKMEERSRILNSYCDESKTFCPWIAQPECRNNEGSLVPCIQLDYNLWTFVNMKTIWEPDNKEWHWTAFPIIAMFKRTCLSSQISDQWRHLPTKCRDIFSHTCKISFRATITHLYSNPWANYSAASKTMLHNHSVRSSPTTGPSPDLFCLGPIQLVVLHVIAMQQQSNVVEHTAWCWYNTSPSPKKTNLHTFVKQLRKEMVTWWILWICQYFTQGTSTTPTM